MILESLTAERLPPWILHPYRLVSLGEIMRRFRGDFYFLMGKTLGMFVAPREMHAVDENLPMNLSGDMKSAASAPLQHLERETRELGWNATAASAQRMLAIHDKADLTFAEYRVAASELEGRLRDEMAGTLFYSLTAQQADYYTQSTKGWETVVAQFPSTVLDIEESSKCLACNRYTASVFHLMRVVESGLRVLGVALKDPNLDPSTNPTWERILSRCDAELQKPKAQRAPEWAANDVFFADAVANLRAVKDAWRNPTLHVGKLYDEEKALDVRHAVRAFMRHLVTKLHE